MGVPELRVTFGFQLNLLHVALVVVGGGAGPASASYQKQRGDHHSRHQHQADHDRKETGHEQTIRRFVKAASVCPR